MKKIIDGLVVFVSSLLALFIFSSVSKYINNIYTFFDIEKSMGEKIDEFVLAFFITVLVSIYQMSNKMIYNKVQRYFCPVQIEIHFIDANGKKVSKVDFDIKNNQIDQKNIGIRINIKKSGRLTLTFAKKMGFVFILEYNPNYFSTELQEGFLAGKSSPILKLASNGEIMVDIFSVLKPSPESIVLDEYIVIQPKFLNPLKGKMTVKTDFKEKLGLLFSKIILIQCNGIDLNVRRGE